MTIVDRTFTKIYPNPEPSEAVLLRISDFFDKSAIVVLGDPGSGKTTSFEESARIEPDAKYVKIRDFLALSPLRVQEKILYLDGLDEQRAKTLDGSGVLDQIRTRLDELGCPPFRLSCRTYDWYGSSDVSSLSLVSKDSSITVLGLDPLTQQDIRLIVDERLDDSDAFIEEAKQHGIYELLGNPQTLNLIIEVISKQGRWPETRSDIFQQAVKILSREINEDHARTETGAQSVDAIVEKSGYLCAIQLCSGIEGFSRSSPNSSDEYPYVEDLPGDTIILRAATERRLFRSEGPELIAPLHRTVSEYAAANYLTNLVRRGFPIGRVLALVTGSDGGILSDLRGLFGWMACLCQDYAESLIPRDPLGVVLYGDPKILSTSNKKLVFESFKKVAEQDPWFKVDKYYSLLPFGGLCSTDMEQYFIDILEDTSQHPVVIACVLDAICNGIPLPELGDLLIDIIRSNIRHEFVRVGALEAFQNACPDSTDVLKQLLEDIHTENINDNDCRLRGMLLDKLYPDVIRPDTILDYLVNSPENVISRYFMFVHNDLVKRTPTSDLPKLIDAVAISDPLNRCRREDITNKHMWEGFIGKLLVKTVTEYGNNCPVSDLYRWLGLAVNKYGRVKIEREESEAVRSWLEEHQGRIFDLFEYWISITAPDDLQKMERHFWERLHRVRPPKGFAQWMLKKVEEDPESQVAEFLFLTAANHRTWDNREDAPTIDELFTFVQKYLRFKDILHEASYCEIEEWRIEDAILNKKHELDEKRIKSENIKTLTNDLEKIRSGEALGHLDWLANHYFGMRGGSNDDINPKERLVEETNPVIALATLEGFSAILSKPGIPSPEQIAALKVKKRRSTMDLAVLVGMDTTADLSIEGILSLPDETLKAALVFHFLSLSGHERPWVPYLINKRPLLASEVLESFWRPLFKKRLDIPGLYELHQEEYMAGVANRICLPLLKDFPNCREESLRNLLHSALLYADHQELIQLSSDILNRKGAVSKSQRVLWFATAFMLAPETFSDRLERYIAKDNTKIVTLVEFIMRFMARDGKSNISLSLSAVKTLIILGTRVVTPTDDMHSDLHVRNLLNYLENDTSAEASETLKDLIEKRELSAWRDTLKHSLTVQLKKRREAEFCYPSLYEVVSTLDNLYPSNYADLQALVLDSLLRLSDEMRDGASDGYKIFWNVNQYSTPTDPRPENDGRDRLLERLNRDLSRLNIHAEREGDYAEHKRADIKILYNDMNLPIEIKRHYHSELWTAPQEQLIEQYTRDPGTGGRGIYLVLWYGTDCKPVRRPPSNIPRPGTAEDLEKALKLVIPDEHKELIQIIVFDVSKRIRQ